MAGSVISISVSPFRGDMLDLWSRVTALLTSEFSLSLGDSEVAELTHSNDEGWALGVGFEDLDLSLEDFLRLSQGAVIRANLRSSGLQLHTEINFFRDPPSLTGTPCLCVSFGTFLHRQLYPDVRQPRAEDHPRRALLRLCFALVETLKAEAFIIEDNDSRLFRPLDPEEFARFLLAQPARLAATTDMQSRLAMLEDRIGYYQGVNNRYLSRAELVDAWRGAGGTICETLDGHVTIDML